MWTLPLSIEPQEGLYFGTKISFQSTSPRIGQALGLGMLKCDEQWKIGNYFNTSRINCIKYNYINGNKKSAEWIIFHAV